MKKCCLLCAWKLLWLKVNSCKHQTLCFIGQFNWFFQHDLVWQHSNVQKFIWSTIGNVLYEKLAKLLYNSYILSQFNYCSIIWMFCFKTKFKKRAIVKKRFMNRWQWDSNVFWRELPNPGQGIRVHCNTLFTEIYKYFQRKIIILRKTFLQEKV